MKKIFMIFAAFAFVAHLLALHNAPSKQEIKTKFVDSCILSIVDTAHPYSVAQAYCECVFYESGGSFADSVKGKISGLDNKKMNQARVVCAKRFLK